MSVPVSGLLYLSFSSIISWRRAAAQGAAPAPRGRPQRSFTGYRRPGNIPRQVSQRATAHGGLASVTWRVQEVQNRRGRDGEGQRVAQALVQATSAFRRDSQDPPGFITPLADVDR
jgi:hypothetical protein